MSIVRMLSRVGLTPLNAAGRGLVLCWMVSACARGAEERGEPLTLRSGRTVEVLALGRRVGSEGYERYVRYRATTDDLEVLKREADELTEVGIPAAVKSGDSAFVVEPTRPGPAGLGRRVIRLPYRRTATGDWLADHPPGGPAGGR